MDLVTLALLVVVVILSVVVGVFLARQGLGYVPAPKPAQSRSEPATTSKKVVKLSVVRSQRRCDHCASFDLEEGQAVMRLYPNFLAAAQHVTPARMAQRYNEEGEMTEDSSVPIRAKWTEFGLCLSHQEVRWSGDACEKFQVMDEPAEVSA